MIDPKMFSDPHSGKEKIFYPSRGLRWHAPWKILKIKGPRLAKNAFPEISAWKFWIKISQHVALLLNLGAFKNCLLAWGGISPFPPLATALQTQVIAIPIPERIPVLDGSSGGNSSMVGGKQVTRNCMPKLNNPW